MTTTADNTPVETVTLTIDEVEVTVPKGTLVIRAAEQVGIQIPRFCDHPLLAPVGACRQCLVEVGTPDREGVVRQMPKPQPSCAIEATPGMVVQTQRTSEVADKAQHGIMEFLLINHPLDCPTCDKGGECPLQNQAMSNGRATSRFVDIKRTFPKPLTLSSQILLDRERCILCQRCTRFSKEIAGDAFIDLQKRGAMQQIGRFDTKVLDFADDDASGLVEHEGLIEPAEVPAEAVVNSGQLDTSGLPFASYYSGNTIQICPVGALTSAAYRFRSRPFDLVSTPGVSEHDSSGSAIRVDHRRGKVMRRLAGNDPEVNEEWITDKDRFAFTWQAAADRITAPLVRNADGELEEVSWGEALEAAWAGLSKGAAVLTGGRLTLEDAYGYAKFARTVLKTNDIDSRNRPHSAEELQFLSHAVAGKGIGVTFTDLEKAPATLLAGFEPEEEGGVVFLRLRKGVLANKNRVLSVAPWATRGLQRLAGELIPAAPGTETEVLDAIAPDGDLSAHFDTLSAAGAVIVVGERLVSTPGAYSAALRLAERTGARLAWIPRRAGERGAVEAGALPTLLPGGRLVSDAAARLDTATVWSGAGAGAGDLPEQPGRSTNEILAAAAAGEIPALLVAGVDPADLPNETEALAALDNAFVVSLEVRASAVTSRADVVLPVVPPVERPGTYVNWEGRTRPFPQALTTTGYTDLRVLNELAAEAGGNLGVVTTEDLHTELAQFAAWDGARQEAPTVQGQDPEPLPAGSAVLSTWHQLLDEGRMQDGEPYLRDTAKQVFARVSAVTAAAVGLIDETGATVRNLRVSTETGAIELPVLLTEMSDHVVWLPTASAGSHVRSTLGVTSGAVVQVATAPEQEQS